MWPPNERKNLHIDNEQHIHIISSINYGKVAYGLHLDLITISC
jgi:hypothetical protein